MLIYQFHLISRKYYHLLTFINRVTSGKVFCSFTDPNLFAKNVPFFSRTQLSERKTYYAGALITYAPTHHNVMGCYMGCDM